MLQTARPTCRCGPTSQFGLDTEVFVAKVEAGWGRCRAGPSRPLADSYGMSDMREHWQQSNAQVRHVGPALIMGLGEVGRLYIDVLPAICETCSPAASGELWIYKADSCQMSSAS